MPFKKQTLPILINATKSKLQSPENEVEVSALQSVIFALGRMEDKLARQRILEFADHRSEDIRYAVVHGLLTIDEDDEIAALIKLSRDTDEDVRNWATFGLGTQIDRDTAEIRDALAQRLNEGKSDVEQEILGEALVGLARRKDKQIVDLLLKRLENDSVGSLDVEAAAEIGDARLCEALLKLKKWWDVNESLLEEAIENCCNSNKENFS